MTVTVVTGAGSGIGRATASRFARKGSAVVVADINEKTGTETADLIRKNGGNAIFRRLDVADVADWEDFTDWVCAEFDVPDVVVNNAGILIGGGFLEQSGDDWRRMIAINLMSPLIGSRLFVERMVDAGRRGHIVNVASVGAFLPTSVAPSYVTAKAGVWLGTQALRQEFGSKGIGVSAICPGLIRTSLAANGTRAGVDESESSAWSARLAAGHRIIGRSPDRVASAIERAVRWNLSTVPVGTEAWAGYYLSRLSPSAVRGLSGLASMDFADRGVSLSGKVFGGAR
ncbi:SDR family NAD(P)-dependent oxidoreductase [Antrihabitans sp. YC3-6]|uniref:SDR family NAD(P)-dependent oxidoreductase n=1 Tax=Antrihabitans stalagmiti TaxID=2799499 RepID=A0A934NVQ4_9NOCA|nr:SDR family NAD(P)-dependent oxidoreductase [Antrihabitans stalagmiti]MBJ8342020.1 SDR family NAD(P)-dependent oxidoreductase [Antrihabitans stalagmiti]